MERKEEEKEETKEEAPKKDILSEVRQEREALEKVRDETQRLTNQLKELRATEILSGKSEVTPQQKEEQESDYDYAQRALRGQV